ncbi:MAG: RNA methyltransferase [Bacteroidales bacterium]|nr:RNA methyltransferase [Bacteroidales bacterium]MBQ9529231.1 RNA methyltransferase [Bacteroidales bacterium]
MISKAEIKRIHALRAKKQRDESGLFVVEGEKLVAEALASGFEIENVYRIEDIGREAMERITMLSSPSPALAVVRIPGAPSLADIDALVASRPLCLALDSVRDPGNLGTIVRIADWFGIDAIFASEDTVELYNPKTVQATMGAIFRRKVIYCDLPEVARKFTAAGMPVFGTFLDGNDIYGEDLSQEGLIVMGSESNGIGPEMAQLVSRRLFIPPYPRGAAGSESLNVAIATAVTCALFRR